MTVCIYKQCFPVFRVYLKTVFNTFLECFTLQPVCVFVIIFTITMLTHVENSYEMMLFLKRCHVNEAEVWYSANLQALG